MYTKCMYNCKYALDAIKYIAHHIRVYYLRVYYNNVQLCIWVHLDLQGHIDDSYVLYNN